MSTGRSGRAASAARRRRGTRRAAPRRDRATDARAAPPRRRRSRTARRRRCGFRSVTASRSESTSASTVVGVERFQCRGVHNGDVDAVLGQARRRPAGPAWSSVRSDIEHHVGAAAQHLGLAQFEGVVVFVEHGRHLTAQQPQVGRSRRWRPAAGRPGRCRPSRTGRRWSARGCRGRSPRPRWPDATARIRWSGRAVRRRCLTFRPGSAMSRQMKSYARRVANTEVGRREGHQTGLGHARGGAEQQLLGHAHLEEPLRELFGEDVHVGVLCRGRRSGRRSGRRPAPRPPGRARTGPGWCAGLGRRTTRSSPRCVAVLRLFMLAHFLCSRRSVGRGRVAIRRRRCA